MESIDGLPDRIRAAAKFVGGVKALAEKAGIPLRSMNEYLGGVKLPLNRAIAIAGAAEVSLHWLAIGEGVAQTPERIFKFIEDTGGEAARKAPQQTVPVIGMAACGIQGWFNRDPLTVRAAWPGGVTDPDAFGVMAVGLSLRPAGIEPGFLCLCAPSASLDTGDLVFVERSDGHVSLKRYDGQGSKGKDWIRLAGWLNPDSAGRQAPYIDESDLTYIKRLAPVIYVKRKL